MSTDAPIKMNNYNNARKVSKYGVFPGPYFPVLGPGKTPFLDTFHSV